jgi:hypothetical protein
MGIILTLLLILVLFTLGFACGYAEREKSYQRHPDLRP